VVLLASHFAAQLGKDMRGREATISDTAIAALRTHRWPGNVRELENAIERACILADDVKLEPRDLGLGVEDDRGPADFGFNTTGTLGEAAARAVELVERRKIAETLAAHDGHKSRAAEALGVSYKTLLTKIKEYGL
jgi:DNA-binding NtrC family response regulator